MRNLIVFLLMISIVGCAGMAHISSIPVPSTRIDVESFEIGTIQEKTVGETMVRRINARVYPGFVAKESFQPRDGYGTQYYTVPAGSEWKASGETDDGNYVCKRAGSAALSRYGWEYTLLIKKTGEVYGVGNVMNNFIVEFSEQDRTFFEPREVYEAGGFKQELIYNGKSKDTIKFQYREFSDNMARPAFSQDLLYDMSESKTIGFRGMNIEVLEATNSLIRFIVRSKMQK